ncbi:hypothetical protein ACC761_36065 [Rhizobium ruizarguesonis]|uniref:Uncharacterized protein n=1 Tax=Rhizobium ruizarguesonis TaxID=2081791 RepID=A0AB38HSV8_9HYPH|nr:hypothetical protein [Rhizobium ruizarguesonis]TBC01353.1 hypothetical protein ELH40_38750 [Rhizobium ruizarguesonis]
MARYLIEAPRGSLTEDRRVKLCEAIKTTHAFVTGATWMSTRIGIFSIAVSTEDPPVPGSDRLFVHGFAEKDPWRPIAELLRFSVRSAAAHAAGLDKERVIVSVREMSFGGPGGADREPATGAASPYIGDIFCEPL